MGTELVAKEAPKPSFTATALTVLDDATNARFAADEFLDAKIENGHTRRAYIRAVNRFLEWCPRRKVKLSQVTPGLAGQYFGTLKGSAPTKNQALSALRFFYDILVTRHAVPLNSFASVRGVRHKIKEGKTAEISIAQARKLLSSIDTSTLVGLRDRAVLGVLAYTGVRVGAVAKLCLSDLRDLGEQRVLHFIDKNGDEKEIPVRHNLERWLKKYIAAAGIAEDKPHLPLFRGADRKRDTLASSQFTAHGIRQMMKRRLNDAGLPKRFSPHSFRVTVITDLLSQNVAIGDVQYLAGHASPTTTALYDRRQRRVTRNIVERISI